MGDGHACGAAGLRRPAALPPAFEGGDRSGRTEGAVGTARRPHRRIAPQGHCASWFFRSTRGTRTDRVAQRWFLAGYGSRRLLRCARPSQTLSTASRQDPVARRRREASTSPWAYLSRRGPVLWLGPFRCGLTHAHLLPGLLRHRRREAAAQGVSNHARVRGPFAVLGV